MLNQLNQMMLLDFLEKDLWQWRDQTKNTERVESKLFSPGGKRVHPNIIIDFSIKVLFVFLQVGVYSPPHNPWHRHWIKRRSYEIKNCWKELLGRKTMLMCNSYIVSC